jgi:tRNA-(ms[2]io[6]A)-hydroxylase
VSRPGAVALIGELPLRAATPRSWAEKAAADLPVFLADHAVCEQQAALAAMNLISHYPDDEELVRRMSALASEELSHLRRVTGILHRRGLRVARRRANPYVQALHGSMRTSSEPELKADRLLVAALIEARSCERFTALLDVVHETDREVADLLEDLGPAEKRHWEMFYALAARELSPDTLPDRWDRWLDREAEIATTLGVGPTVHG